MSEHTHTLTVDRPVHEVYGRWTRFEDFPAFMEGVEEVRQIDDSHTSWDVEIAGVERHFEATIVEQRPDELVRWETTDGALHGGSVSFQSKGPEQTEITLAMNFEPEGFVEKAGDALGVVGGRVKGDLERFKDLAEREGGAEGWRGEIRQGDVVRGAQQSESLPRDTL